MKKPKFNQSRILVVLFMLGILSYHNATAQWWSWEDGAFTNKGYIVLDNDNDSNGRTIAFGENWPSIITYRKRDRNLKLVNHSSQISLSPSQINLSTSQIDLSATSKINLQAQNVYVGTGQGDATRLVDINGALRVRSGGYKGDPLIDLDHTSGGSRRWARINSEGQLALASNDQLTAGNSKPHLLINQLGVVQITGGNNLMRLSSPKHALYVQKGITSSDYSIGPKNTWADYVFAEEYQIMPLKELKSYIKEKRRLPNMPSQAEIANSGYNLHEVNVKLLEKIEELTLYVLQQQQQIEELKQQ